MLSIIEKSIKFVRDVLGMSKENVTFVGKTKLKTLNSMKPMIKYRGASIKTLTPKYA